jgi:hypothetical protein
MVATNLRQRIDAALKQSADWELVDKVLLNLCKTYPTHKFKDQVSAKVALIGRTYVTGVERAFKGGAGQGDALTKIVDYIHSKRKAFDEIIVRIPDTDVLTEDALGPIVVAQSNFLNLLSESDQCRRRPRAFVSKYLHFHRPVVPIYDSYVVGVISKLVKPPTRLDRNYPANVDSDYASYLEKFWQVNGLALAVDRRLTVKQLDTYLLWEAHQRAA